MKSLVAAVAVLSFSFAARAEPPFELQPDHRGGENKAGNNHFSKPRGAAGGCYFNDEELDHKHHLPKGDEECLVQYLENEQARAEYKYTFDPKTLTFVKADTKAPLDTGGGKAIYVVDPKDHHIFYVRTPYEPADYAKQIPAPLAGTFHHSSFLAGGLVWMAGELTADKGHLTYIDNNSGHYKPTIKPLQELMAELKIPKDSYSLKDRVTGYVHKKK